jgi:hypothetical protein
MARKATNKAPVEAGTSDTALDLQRRAEKAASDFHAAAAQLMPEAMVKKRDNSDQIIIKAISELSAEQAYSTGHAVLSLIKEGVRADRAIDSTVAIAEFIKRGLTAQQAVDAILGACARRSRRS